ncbi:putative cysteine protease YraA isoform X1 [Branchiostoma lanceolatum]|uniref:putative cysteine protease YraA isoform X1 n=1 Tax=Branchiostoma lanceolatum TaxID=7740 RepID=UPI003455F461
MAMGGKTVGVLVEFNYEDLEVWYPLLRFREEGFMTVAIGPEKDKSYTSKHGYPCKSTASIDAVAVADLAALVIPGGWAPDYWRRDPRFVNLVRDMFNAGKPVAAICHGAWMFCSARIIKDKKLNCFHAIKDDVINAGGLYEDSAVVVDGNLITSRVPGDLPQFCKAILQQLQAQ